jgi:hypothetical protein
MASISRPPRVEDISELTRRKGVQVIKVRLNKVPQMEEVDQRIGQLVDILMILDKSMDKIEQEYFQEMAPVKHSGEEWRDSETDIGDKSWSRLQREYEGEIRGKDEEYEALLRRFSLEPVE